MVKWSFKGFRPRPKGIYPIVDGILHAELLPPEAAVQLTAGDRYHREPYVGVTFDGNVVPDLYSLLDSGASGKAAVDAARSYLSTLAPHQRTVAVLPMDSPNWRRWTNAFPTWAPNGLQLGRLAGPQRVAALELIEASLSREGFATVRAAMKLNGALGQLVDDYRDSLQEFAYWLTLFGDPSDGDPWGWQLMGHHVDLHCVFIGSQLVFAPVFLGAEPVETENGSYDGLRSFDAETDRGLDLRRALDPDQETQVSLGRSMLTADLPTELAGPFNGRHLSGAGADNLVLAPAGIPGSALTPDQQDLLLRLVSTYVDRMPVEHARRKLAQVRSHLDQTYFAWRGQHDDTSPFYYRVHSPVILVEYDNHPGIFLDNDEPERFHVHTIVREPNGNDYGKSLLRQHYARFHGGQSRLADTAPIPASDA